VNILNQHSFGVIDLSFSNWSKFPLYKCDFGHGGGKYFKISPIKYDALIFILPTSNNDEIELHTTFNYNIFILKSPRTLVEFGYVIIGYMTNSFRIMTDYRSLAVHKFF